MAQIYSPPEDIKRPKLDTQRIGNYIKDCEKFREEISQFCKENGKGKYKGKLVRFPMADGYAIYYIMSLSPLMLIHDPSGDGWHDPNVQYLPAKVIKQNADSYEAITEMFGGN